MGLKGQESNGQWVNMADCFNGPLTMLVQGGIWDLVTLEQLKVIRDIFELYRREGLRVVFLASDQPGRENLHSFKDVGAYNFDCFQDDDNFETVFGKERIIPCIKLVDNKGIIQARFNGYTTKEQLEPLVKKYLEAARLKKR